MAQEFWFNKKTKTNVSYKGRKNKLEKENESFVSICKLSEKQLKNFVAMFLLDAGYKDVQIDNGYVYAKGEIPFCVTAHLDTVHDELVQDTYEFNSYGDYILSSPQGIGGDDRCGVYMIMQLLNKGYKPYVVFCEQEEKGCIGSREFCKTKYIKEIGKECKYIIELDRANKEDAVFYDCDNPEFTEFITSNTGYKKEWGSCSDISYLCPEAGIAGVNLSCGYYDAHTIGESVNMTHMMNTIDVVEKLLNTECIQYEYIEAKKYSYYGKGNYYSWFDDYEDYWYSNYQKKTYGVSSGSDVTTAKPANSKSTKVYLEVLFYDKEYDTEISTYTSGETESECWKEFFFTYPYVCYNDIWEYEVC